MTDTHDTPPLDHECWWKNLAEGLSATLADLDNDSADSALRQILRTEKTRRHAAETHAIHAAHREHQATSRIEDLEMTGRDILAAYLEAIGSDQPQDVADQVASWEQTLAGER